MPLSRLQCSSVSLGFNLPPEIWQRLEKLHLIQSRSRVLQLKQQFQNLKKEGLSITDYLDKMKSIADALEAIAQPITDYDLCNQRLNGLGPEYDSVHTSIANRDTSITFEELFGQLLTFELRLELHHSTPAIEQLATALYTNMASQCRSGPCGRSTYHGRGRDRQNVRGGSSNNSNNFTTSKSTSSTSYQICNRVGHSALDCFHQLDLSFQGRQPLEKLQAMVAAKQGASTWFTGTGATNHVTPDLGNLSIHTDYAGTDNLAVGNGKELPISHVGSTHCLSNTTHAIYFSQPFVCFPVYQG